MTKEKIVRVLFKSKYPNEKVFYNYRPDWLINPKTGYPLELDIYYPNLNFAIEIQGIHHETNYQIYKDNVKKEICDAKNITLYSLPIKKKALLKLLEKHNIEIPKELKSSVKWFASGHPRRSSKMYKYYTQTLKKIKAEKAKAYWDNLREQQQRH